MTSSLLSAALHACSDTVTPDARHLLMQKLVSADGTRYVLHFAVVQRC